MSAVSACPSGKPSVRMEMNARRMCRVNTTHLPRCDLGIRPRAGTSSLLAMAQARTAAGSGATWATVRSSRPIVVPAGTGRATTSTGARSEPAS